MHLSSQTLAHAPLAASTTASSLSGGVPGGTIATIFAMTKDVPHTLLSRSKRDWALSPVLGAHSPAHRFVYSLGSRRGAISPIGIVNTSIIQRTAGLLRLAHLVRERGPVKNAVEPPPSYGPAFTYTEFMLMGGAVSAFFTSLTIFVVLMGITFIAPVSYAVPPSRCGQTSPLNCVCVFTVPVAGQAPSNAARIGARRSVSYLCCLP